MIFTRYFKGSLHCRRRQRRRSTVQLLSQAGPGNVLLPIRTYDIDYPEVRKSLDEVCPTINFPLGKGEYAIQLRETMKLNVECNAEWGATNFHELVASYSLIRKS